MLETSRLPKGEKGKERRGISVLKQTRRSPDRCWEKGRGRPWRGWSQGGLAEEPSPGRVGGMERDGGSTSRAGFVPAPPCAGRPAVFPSREAGMSLGIHQKSCCQAVKQEGRSCGVTLCPSTTTTRTSRSAGTTAWLLDGAPPAPGCLTARSAGPQRGKQSQSRRAKPQVPCCLPSAWGMLSKEEMHTQRPLLSKDQSQLRENPLGWQQRN